MNSTSTAKLLKQQTNKNLSKKNNNFCLKQCVEEKVKLQNKLKLNAKLKRNSIKHCSYMIRAYDIYDVYE